MLGNVQTEQKTVTPQSPQVCEGSQMYTLVMVSLQSHIVPDKTFDRADKF